MFTCNGTKGGHTSPHQHDSVVAARACYGVGISTQPAPVSASTAILDAVTAAQARYITGLGGTVDPHMTKRDASLLIQNLKSGKVSPVPPVPPKVTAPVDPRLTMIEGLLDMVPDGYFAGQQEEGATVTFIRISTPINGRYRGARKIQSIHGPRLDTDMVLWPSKRWSIYNHSLVEPLMWVIADYQTSARRYAQKINKCCRCNARLTDERSRHYGIGPECEKHWPWIISYVDENDAS